MSLKPLIDNFAVMNPMINQDQTIKKPDQNLGGHRLTVKNEPDFALIGYCRDHIDNASLGIQPDNRCLFFRGKSFGVIGFVVYSCLITPMDLSLFLFCSGCYLRIACFKLLFQLFRTLLICSFSRFLWSETPSFETIANSSQRQIHLIVLLDCHSHRIADPEGKRRLKLIRRQTIALFSKKISNSDMTDLMSVSTEICGKCAKALCDPQKERFGIAHGAAAFDKIFSVSNRDRSFSLSDFLPAPTRRIRPSGKRDSPDNSFIPEIMPLRDIPVIS
jgi:hypothetical protein